MITPMKELEALEDSEASRAFAQSFIDERLPAFDDYCGLACTRGPVFVWAAGEAPDLGRKGLHLIEGDLIVPDESLSDLELDQWRPPRR